MLVSSNEISGEDTLVCLRTLHKKLGSKRKIYDWAKDRLSDLMEGVDYTQHKIVSQYNQLDRVEYFITIEAAKHLSMLERTEAGKSIRQYFIEVEKSWRAEQLIKLEKLKVLEAKEARREAAKENVRYPVVKEVTYFDDHEEITRYSFISQLTPPTGLDRALTTLTQNLRGVHKALAQVKEHTSRIEDIPEEVYLVSGEIVFVRDLIKNIW